MAEDYISDVVLQMQAGHKLKVDAMDRDNTTLLAEGVVLTVDNQIDPTTGTVKVRATFPNTNYKLFPNEFVNARLLVKTLWASTLFQLRQSSATTMFHLYMCWMSRTKFIRRISRWQAPAT